MLKSELLAQSGWKFLATTQEQVVCVTEGTVVAGVEVGREIVIIATRQLHQMLQSMRYNFIPQEYVDAGITYRVVTLDDALSSLFRAHPYTDSPIMSGDDPFHHTQLTHRLFLAFLFAQEIGDYSKTAAGRQQQVDLENFLGDRTYQQTLLVRITKAGDASSIGNPDRSLVKAAEARFWYNNPSTGTSSQVPITGILDPTQYNLFQSPFALGIALHVVCKVLTQVDVFENDQALWAVFADERIASWQRSLPEADSRTSRVSYLVNYLNKAFRADTKQNVLALFIYVLLERTAPTDELHSQLAALIS